MGVWRQPGTVVRALACSGFGTPDPPNPDSTFVEIWEPRDPRARLHALYPLQVSGAPVKGARGARAGTEGGGAERVPSASSKW